MSSTVVLAEGVYRNVETCYRRRLPDRGWVLFDDNGRECLRSPDLSVLFFWAAENEIAIVTIH